MSYNSSSDEELTYHFDQNIVDDDEHEEAMHRMIANNIMLQESYFIQQNTGVIHGGSVAGHATIYRNCESADVNLFNDYFAENPSFNETMFRRRYQMSRSLFLRILDEVKRHDNYFEQRSDAYHRMGLSSLQKVTAVFRMLAYGVPADVTDEYIKIGESTAIESMKRVCRAIVEIFAEQYLRTPTAADVARLLNIA